LPRRRTPTPDVAAALLKHWKNGKALATFTPEL
jgi:hypothetical protein